MIVLPFLDAPDVGCWAPVAWRSSAATHTKAWHCACMRVLGARAW